jgi:hypothetical protein
MSRERDERDRRARAEYGLCPDCDAPLPDPWTERCRHQRACEARVMLRNGVPSAVAAAHAQRLPAPKEDGDA